MTAPNRIRRAEPYKTRARIFSILVLLLVLLTGAAVGAKAALALTVTHWNATSSLAFSAEQPLPIPSLAFLSTQQAALDYFTTHKHELAALFNESRPERLASLYVMYQIHSSHLYGEVDPDHADLDYEAWLTYPFAHCGTYALQAQALMAALGLTTRRAALSGGTHQWVEVAIDGHWELFDPTTNLWIDHSGAELMAGVERKYRYFYTPLLDRQHADQYQAGLQQAGQNLRAAMPLLGVGWYPKAVVETL